MAAHLALYKGKGLIGNALVRVWTRSIYSHCELVIDDAWYSSSLMDGGVRAKQIAMNPDHWDLIRLPDSVAPLILEHYVATAGQRYGWLDLIRSQIFNGNHDEAGASFCSEWCAAALRLPNPASYSPRTLAELVAWIMGANTFAAATL